MEMHTYDSLRAVHGLDGRKGNGTCLKRIFSRLLKRIKEAHGRQRDYGLLITRSNHELRDIGLTRNDVIGGLRYRDSRHAGAAGDELC
jgi:uncharacterized protein YjiS (DUF1127 family)